jgi:hypothetical protein
MCFDEFLQTPAAQASIAALQGGSFGVRTAAVDILATLFSECDAPSARKCLLTLLAPAHSAPVTVSDREALDALWRALDTLPSETINDELTRAAVRVLRDLYSPRFNEHPQGTLVTIAAERQPRPLRSHSYRHA